MSYLGEADPGPERNAIYAAGRDRLGYVSNYVKVFGHRPRVYRAWEQLNAAIKAEMDPVRYEVATIGAARALHSSYCALAHGSVLAGYLDESTVLSIATDADEDAERTAVADLGRRVAEGPADITEADLSALRELGFDDADILDVILAAAARCFFSSVLEATGAEPDVAYAKLSPPMREALTVGRPIEAGAAVS
jgi:uncharacterized peroxidase-related enzyme